jgi:uncharacterized protein affecting Mg2+/Co2+ transport
LWLLFLVAVTVTNGVRIEATSKYVQSHSYPASDTYRFTYRVTITNQSKDLLGILVSELHCS